MIDESPEPLTPPDGDLRDFAFTPIFRARLFGSRFHARATDTEWRAGVTLWLKSWDQVPAGSLPADDIDLCRLAELGRDQRQWAEIKEVALRGWVRCSDGLLYHPVVAEGVNDALARKRKQSTRGRAGAAEKWRKHKNSLQQASETDGTSIPKADAKQCLTDAQAMLGDGKGQGQRKKETSLRDAKKAGARIPADWGLTPTLRAYAVLHGVDPDLAAEEFRNFWMSATKNPTKLDWDKTFQNRVLELQDQSKFRLRRQTNGMPPAPETMKPFTGTF